MADVVADEGDQRVTVGRWVGNRRSAGALLKAVQSYNLAGAKVPADRIWHTSQVFYSDAFGDKRNLMKEALVLPARQKRPVARLPVVNFSIDEIACSTE